MKIKSYTKEYIRKSDNHLYIAPDKELRHCIAHYTITFQNKDKVIPKGTVLHIIPDLSGCIVMPLHPDIKMRMWGPMTKAVTLNNDLNTAEHRFFIEFLPGGLYSFLPKSMDAFVDNKIELDELLPELYEEFTTIINTSTTYDRMVERINNVCKNYIKRNKEDRIYREFIKAVQEDDFTTSSLSNQFQVSERQIHRYFKKYIGISGTAYKKIMNLNRLLPTLDDTSLTDIAHQNEYFDQAHFNHVFKEICKATPTKYIHNLSEFYNEIYKF
ncbi:MAG: helix-turn-helix domain-containing protein [Coprobacillaceae bacterium]